MDAITMLYLAAQAALSAVLWWSSFCRLTHIARETIREIALAFWFQGAMSTTLLIAPYLPLLDDDFKWQPYTTPLPVWLCMLASIVFIQIATARHWVAGVPRSYIKPEHRPMRRSQDFKDTFPC